MIFKNLQVYRLPAPWSISAEQLESHLSAQAFAPCESLDMQKQGWVSPRQNNQLVHAVNRQFLLQLNTEKKLLPNSVINQVTKARAAELEEQQGFPPGRKQTKELKETVTDELLPRAFSISSSTHVWLDPVNGWLVVDSGSPARAEEILKLLLKAIPQFPLETLRTMRSPLAAMTDWLAADEAPEGFTVDQETELRAVSQDKATVRYIRHSLEVNDTRRHIESGKQCTRLALTWADKISFVLTENFSIKRVCPLDVLKEDVSGVSKNDNERFDGDFMLMTGELNKLLDALITALGGMHVEQPNATASASAAPAESENPVLSPATDNSERGYDQAVKVVLTQRRASVSLIQRHLRIGYNHAARLLEQMEQSGIIGTMQANGSREVLVRT